MSHARFLDYGEMDETKLLMSFQEITNTDERLAKHYMESAVWQFDLDLHNFYYDLSTAELPSQDGNMNKDEIAYTSNCKNCNDTGNSNMDSNVKESISGPDEHLLQAPYNPQEAKNKYLMMVAIMKIRLMAMAMIKMKQMIVRCLKNNAMKPRRMSQMILTTLTLMPGSRQLRRRREKRWFHMKMGLDMTRSSI